MTFTLHHLTSSWMNPEQDGNQQDFSNEVGASSASHPMTCYLFYHHFDVVNHLAQNSIRWTFSSSWQAYTSVLRTRTSNEKSRPRHWPASSQSWLMGTCPLASLRSSVQHTLLHSIKTLTTTENFAHWGYHQLSDKLLLSAFCLSIDQNLQNTYFRSTTP